MKEKKKGEGKYGATSLVQGPGRRKDRIYLEKESVWSTEEEKNRDGKI